MLRLINIRDYFEKHQLQMTKDCFQRDNKETVTKLFYPKIVTEPHFEGRLTTSSSSHQQLVNLST